MQYSVVFDVAQSGYRNWWFPGFGLIFILAGGLIFYIQKRGRKSAPRWFSSVFISFSVLWTCFAFIVTAEGYYGLVSALHTGRCDIVEGEVENFHPMPVSGHGEESFDVQGQHFHYSDYIVSPGFNKTSSHGGPICAGVYVRIHYLGNDIAELEVANK